MVMHLADHTGASNPQNELRVAAGSMSSCELWQVGSPVSPQITVPKGLGGLKGRNLFLIEHGLSRWFREAGNRSDPVAIRTAGIVQVDECVALTLGLLFRSLAPVRSCASMIPVAKGIKEMEEEEAAYWMGMPPYRRNPQRVLMALRNLLTTTK